MTHFLPGLARSAASILVLAAFLAASGAANAQSSAALAEQSLRVDRVEEQMRQLNGRLDEVTWQMQQIQELLRRMQDDNEFRFRELEGGGQPRKRSEAPAIEPMPSDPTTTAGVYSTGPADAPADLQAGFSIDAPDSIGSIVTANDIGQPPQPLGTIPGDETASAPRSNSALGGPLDLSAIASGGAVYQPPATVSDLGSGRLPPLGGVSSEPLPPPPGVLSNTGGYPPPAAVAPAYPPAGEMQVAAIAPATDPQGAYDQAYGLIVAGDYAGAESDFKRFLSTHPKSKLAGNAQYWLGESFYARGSFREAAEAFLTAYRDYPKSSKAPESLLKLGLSLESLGEKDAACATYGELKKKYPSATEALKSRVAKQSAKAGC